MHDAEIIKTLSIEPFVPDRVRYSCFCVCNLENIINYLTTESEVVTGKSQTEALPYIDRAIARSIREAED